jgi:hypothetical protein
MWILAVACACGKSDAPKPGPTPTPTPAPANAKPAALDGLHVSLAGQPVVMTHAYMKKLSLSGRYQVFVTNRESSCHELMDNLFSKREGEQTLLFNTGERIAPDGTITSIVTDYFHPSATLSPGSKVHVDGNKVTVDFAATGTEVHGTFVAEACGEQPADTSGLPKAKHASTATIDFAGKQLPLTGAVLFGDDVLLSTGPKACTRWLPDAEVMIWRRGGFWHARGAWFDGEIAVSSLPDPFTKDVKIVRGAKGTSDDGPTVQLALSGKGAIEKYPFAIAGTIEAIDCHGDDGVIP